MKTKNELLKQIKSAESALAWYACHCVNHDKQKEIQNGVKDTAPTSLVADRYFKKYGYCEKRVRVIK